MSQRKYKWRTLVPQPSRIFDELSDSDKCTALQAAMAIMVIMRKRVIKNCVVSGMTEYTSHSLKTV